MSGPRVLVTGGSGFVGAHTIVALLAQGHQVRTTVRSWSRADAVREMVTRGGAEPDERLTFAVADLTRDDGWAEAAAGCEVVLHVASPFPGGPPEHEDELIVPARDGAVRVLRAARDAGVRRVVLTSSFAAVGYSPKPGGAAYTEDDWTDPAEPGLSAYAKSKTLAERAAWDFVRREGGTLELAVINPVGIFGPVLGADYASSIDLVRQLLAGAMPAIPRLYFGVVDVRDVAELHLLAMNSPAAAGQRFLAVAGAEYSLPAIAHLLRDRLGAEAAHVPTRVIPDEPGAPPHTAAHQVGGRRTISNAKARRILGWQPRTNEQAVLATARSLLDLNLVDQEAGTPGPG
ncbi:aldehyde reductase [Frankia sp. Mgl5]|uniref:SDR family oxidoreductase n=1 Tax=Frankia sp. Mgl5 TaxID=2933793 RepID=UPI0020105D10|nr:aldehyde reductase [Frankia sp. Mgl5]MCK9926823.1 aldehyde reductase [Frankia sp. Mgl5]